MRAVIVILTITFGVAFACTFDAKAWDSGQGQVCRSSCYTDYAGNTHCREYCY